MVQPTPVPCAVLMAGALLAVTMAAQAGDGSPAWLESSFRRVVVGADAHNADRMLAQIEEVAEAGADTVAFTGHLKGYGWFPSRLAVQNPERVVEDVIAEGARLCREQDVRCVVYVGAPVIQQALVDRDDWRQRGPDGEARDDGGACCLLSPFGDWLIEYLTEIAGHAPLDGIWLDGYPQAPLACACPYCAAAYDDERGRRLPQTGDPNAVELREYVGWWHGKCERHAERLIAAIHAEAPELAVFGNVATGRSPDAWRHASDDICRLLDAPSVEQFWHVDHPGDPLYPLYPVSMVAAAVNGQQVEAFVPLFPHTVDCTTAMPEVESLARTLSVIANGAVPQLAYGPGRADQLPVLLDAIRAREAFLVGAERVRHVGVAASSRTGLQYGRAQAKARYWDAVHGWLRALTEEHFPVELLSDHQLDEGEFDGLAAIVLPATACLSPSAIEALEEFVSDGGGVVATSVASLALDDGELAPDFALADTFGARFGDLNEFAPLPAFITMKPADHPLGRGEWVDDALSRLWVPLGHQMGAVGLPGRFVTFAAASDREVAWQYTDGRPAIITGEVGQGKCAYMGPEVGAAYYANGYPYLRELMAAAVSHVAARPPRDHVAAPLIVQVTHSAQSLPGGERRVIHLLNECSSFGRASLTQGAMPLREEIVPVSGIKVLAGPPVTRAWFEPQHGPLPITALPDGRAEITVPELGLHAMVVLE